MALDITPLPDPPSRADPANFAARGDAFLGALPLFATEMNAFADYYRQFYLGPKASDPVTDNEGEPLITGQLYFNTTLGQMLVYNGTSFVSPAVVGGTVPTLTVTQDFQANSRMLVPRLTEAQRDALTPTDGLVIFNTTINQYEGYFAALSSWASLGGGATGGGADQVFVLNDQVVTEDYTIPVGKNAVSGGPISINDGVVVEIPDGSVWTIV